MQRAMAGSSRAVLVLSLSSSTTRRSLSHSFPRLPTSNPRRVFPGFNFKPLCTTTTTQLPELDQGKHSILLDRLRQRHLREAAKPETRNTKKKSPRPEDGLGKEEEEEVVGSFEELGLTEEVMGAVRELGIEVPTEIQCIGVPAVLDGLSVVLGSHTGSGKTLAYLLPLVQLLRRDEAMSGVLMKPKRPRAVVLLPTRELSEQVFRVSKSISHHAKFRSIMVSGGGRLRPQEDLLNGPIDMVVGTPGRVLQHIEDGNIVYGDIKYLVLDEADTMFDQGFGPDIRKFLGPLKNRASKPNGQGFQTVLVTATITKGVQALIDDEFEGIVHLRTSSLHKKIATCRHDFIKLSGQENKLEALLQVLEPSLAKGNRVMVFCNTLDSSRAVDHFLSENQISTVNYHGEVPAEQRVENLEKFKSDDGDCPTLVCTDLAARGLDFNVDHVILFDFPKNSIDYVHRAGRTARMGAKGRVTSLVAKKDLLLANRIEEAVGKNESLEALSTDGLRRDIARARITEEKSRNTTLQKVTNQKNNIKHATMKPASASSKSGVDKKSGKYAVAKSKEAPSARSSKKTSRFGKTPTLSKRTSETNYSTASRFKVGKKPAVSRKASEANSSAPSKSRAGKKTTVSRRASEANTSAPSKSRVGKKPGRKASDANTSADSKLRVVSFRGRSSSSDKKELSSR